MGEVCIDFYELKSIIAKKIVFKEAVVESNQFNIEVTW